MLSAAPRALRFSRSPQTSRVPTITRLTHAKHEPNRIQILFLKRENPFSKSNRIGLELAVTAR